MSFLKDKIQSFGWDVKVSCKTMGSGMEFEIQHLPELKESILFVPHGNAILIYMNLPSNVSPYWVMSSILGKNYDRMLADFSFNIMDHRS